MHPLTLISIVLIAANGVWPGPVSLNGVDDCPHFPPTQPPADRKSTAEKPPLPRPRSSPQTTFARTWAGLIYVDHGLTGRNKERPGRRDALAAVRAGDTLVLTKLDGFAR